MFDYPTVKNLPMLAFGPCYSLINGAKQTRRPDEAMTWDVQRLDPYIPVTVHKQAQQSIRMRSLKPNKIQAEGLSDQLLSSCPLRTMDYGS